jgi:hypothetical protein
MIENAHQYIGIVEKIYKMPDPSNRAMALTNLYVQNAQEQAKKSFYHELILHLSISLFVAAILVLSVEIAVRKSHRKEIASYTHDISNAVWKAIAGRVIPDAFIDEIDDMLRYEYIKEECIYHFTFEPLPPNVSYNNNNNKENDLIILKRRITYYAVNLTRNNIDFTLKSDIFGALSNECESSGLPISRQLKLWIDDKDIDFVKGSKEIDSYQKIRQSVSIPVGGRRKISILGQELMRNTDQTFYVQGIPVNGLEVVISNKLPELKITNVSLLHPKGEKFTSEQRDQNEGVWKFDGAVLPGQSITIVWRSPPHQGRVNHQNQET